MTDQIIMFISQLFNGLKIGSVYALVALGYTMVYGIIRLINFAHGDFIMVGAYVLMLTIPAIVAMGLPAWVAVIPAILVCVAVGVIVEKAAYKPVREKGNSMTALITAIAMSLLLENGSQAIFGADFQTVPTIFHLPSIAFGKLKLPGDTLLTIVIGLVIAKGKVIPIIATLGFMYIYRGLTYFVSDSTWVGTAYMLQDFKTFAQGTTLGINNLVCITLCVYVVFFIILRWTRIGRQIYAVGSNVEAAEVSGIPIDRIKILVYAINGAIAGLCGSMYTGYYASAQNDMATGSEMDIIAACVIGGVSLSGGQGSVVGVFLGAVTIAVISKSLSMVGIDPFWQQALKGGIILAAIIINVLVQRSITKRTLEAREALSHER